MAQYAFFKAPEWDSDFFLYSIGCIIKYIFFLIHLNYIYPIRRLLLLTRQIEHIVPCSPAT